MEPLAHQLEYLSDRWLSIASETLTALTQQADDLPAFVISESLTNAPSHLGWPDNVASWSARFDGQGIVVDRTFVPTADWSRQGAYQAALIAGQTIGMNVPEVAAFALRETNHWFGDAAVSETWRESDESLVRLIGNFRDHMARRTVENPDIAHRVSALGMTRHIKELFDQGYTVVERAISPEFADALREETVRAVRSHQNPSRSLNGLLYHGLVFERLVQNPQLMTLIDASLGRGAVIASISALCKGPGKGVIPLHTDYAQVPEPYPDYSMTGVGVWALEDWTVASGPTWIIPGSHRLKRGPKPGENPPPGVAIEMPKGSVVYFHQGVWHWQGDRELPGERVSIHAHFNRGILRSLEPKRIDVQMLHRNSPRLGEMLGEDDWFDKLSADGRDYKRLEHMIRLNRFNDEGVAAILAGAV